MCRVHRWLNGLVVNNMGVVGSAALTGMMGSRYLRTRKVMPAGVVSVVSLVMTGAYLHGLVRSSWSPFCHVLVWPIPSIVLSVAFQFLKIQCFLMCLVVDSYSTLAIVENRKAKDLGFRVSISNYPRTLKKMWSLLFWLLYRKSSLLQVSKEKVKCKQRDKIDTHCVR